MRFEETRLVERALRGKPHLVLVDFKYGQLLYAREPLRGEGSRARHATTAPDWLHRRLYAEAAMAGYLGDT